MFVKAFAPAAFDHENPASRYLERSSSGCRANTKAARWDAVERVIRAMYERLDEPLSLQDMADVAMLSPYHLNRVFRNITGLPPRKFLATLRIEAAKRLLLTTDLSVTEVCFEVGYNSQGTFTTLFTQFVGVSPRQLRRFADDHALLNVDGFVDYDEPILDLPQTGPSVTGRISATTLIDSPIFVGLFSTPVPQGRPAGCACIAGLGSYSIPDVPDGHYYVCAVAYDQHSDSLEYLLPNQSTLMVGATQDTVHVKNGQVVKGVADVRLRRTSLMDPPILTALPSLMAQHAQATHVAAA
jgi:AraC-like DNA-binding protein